jgi:hypothetical protein
MLRALQAIEGTPHKVTTLTNKSKNVTTQEHFGSSDLKLGLLGGLKCEGSQKC